MACVNADGSLTPIAQKVLSAILEPVIPMQIQQTSGLPIYRVRASLRELMDLGLVEQHGENYQITDLGKTYLNKST